MRALATAVAFLAAFLQSAATMQTIEVAPWQPPYPIVEPPHVPSQFAHMVLPAQEPLSGNSTFWHRDRNHTVPLDAAKVMTTWINEHQQGFFYPNITALFAGDWWMQELAAAEDDNSTDHRVLLDTTSRLYSAPTKDVSVHDVVGTIKTSLPNGDPFWMVVQGVYLVKYGLAVLSASARRRALETLPFLMPTESLFNQVNDVVLLQMDNPDRIVRLNRAISWRDRVTSTTESVFTSNFSESCEPFLVAKLAPLPNDVKLASIRLLEAELQEDTGIPTIEAPTLYLEGIMFVRNDSCLPLAANPHFNMTGIRIPVFNDKLQNFIVFAVLTTLVEFALTAYQLDRVRSQSAHARVSQLTVEMLILLDAFGGLLYLLIGSQLDVQFFKWFALISFMKTCQSNPFQMRWLLNIRTNEQNPDSEPRNHPRRSMTLRFATLMLIVLAFVLVPPTGRRMVVVVLHCVWIPQIIFSVQSNSHKLFNWAYVVGTTLTRSALPIYLMACPDNVWNTGTYPRLTVFFVVVMFLQATVILLQDKFGSRFFVPQAWTPPSYNYYVRSNLTEAGAEAGHTTEDTTCVICMHSIDVSALHMRTPCNHVFHIQCLEAWMQHKLICPTCRSGLPNTS